MMRKTTPTIKQKTAVSNLIENRGNVSKAMRDAGYEDNSAKNPSNLTNSKGFKELMKKYLPDEMLLKALSEDIEGKPKNRKAELELALKVKGRLTEKHDFTTQGEKLNYTPEQLNAIFKRRDSGSSSSSK